MPHLEASGELLNVLRREREARIARDEYRWGLAYLNGSNGVARDPFAALEWMRRSAEKRDPKGQCAYASMLASGDAGVADVEGAVRWYEGAAAQGMRSALLALGGSLANS